jgi:hypothetical protein
MDAAVRTTRDDNASALSGDLEQSLLQDTLDRARRIRMRTRRLNLKAAEISTIIGYRGLNTVLSGPESGGR